MQVTVRKSHVIYAKAGESTTIKSTRHSPLQVHGGLSSVVLTCLKNDSQRGLIFLDNSLHFVL